MSPRDIVTQQPIRMRGNIKLQQIKYKTVCSAHQLISRRVYSIYCRHNKRKQSLLNKILVETVCFSVSDVSIKS